jgi:membrane protein DedA with SNARE-associated domain
MFDFLSPAWVHDLIQVYGLWVLFGIIMLESMGMPMPGETALVTAALYSATTHQVSIISVISAAAAAAIIGDNLGYLIGRTIGLRLIVRYGRYVGLYERRLKVGQYLFLRHGGKIVFFGRFVAFLRTYAALLAGANLMRWPHFLLMNALGGVCWASALGFGTYLLGGQMRQVSGPAGILVFAVAVILVIAGLVYFRRHEKELEDRAETAIPRLYQGGFSIR